MADVRLTATNPEDSTVVPVACNAKGELKLEEIPDQSFDGTLNGDLTVYGKSKLWGNLEVTNPDDINAGHGIIADGTLVSVKDAGNIYLQTYHNVFTANEGSSQYYILYAGTAPKDGSAGYSPAFIDQLGGCQFANYKFQILSNGEVFIGGNAYGGIATGVRLHPTGTVSVCGGTDNAQLVFATFEEDIADPFIAMRSNGKASFARNNAGFTAEGYLWCKTRRGDTVILDSTSNGLGVWESYDPPSVRQEIKDSWAEKNAIRPKPEESSQD